MSNVLVALFLAAGISAFVYSKIGKRVGYGNAKNVITLVIVSFGLTFIMVMVLLTSLVSLN